MILHNNDNNHCDMVLLSINHPTIISKLTLSEYHASNKLKHRL